MYKKTSVINLQTKELVSQNYATFGIVLRDPMNHKHSKSKPPIVDHPQQKTTYVPYSGKFWWDKKLEVLHLTSYILANVGWLYVSHACIQQVWSTRENSFVSPKFSAIQQGPKGLANSEHPKTTTSPQKHKSWMHISRDNFIFEAEVFHYLNWTWRHILSAFRARSRALLHWVAHTLF